jgi:hypothetical protein
MSKYLDLNFGMPLAIFQNELRQKIERRALVRTHSNQPALQTLHLGNRLPHLIAQTQDALRVVVNHLPRLCEDRSLLSPIQQRQTDFFLQTANRDADRRLRPKDLIGSL